MKLGWLYCNEGYKGKILNSLIGVVKMYLFGLWVKIFFIEKDGDFIYENEFLEWLCWIII